MQVTLAERVPMDALRLQASEVAAVRWVPAADLEARLRSGDPAHVPMAADSTVRCRKLEQRQARQSWSHIELVRSAGRPP